MVVCTCKYKKDLKVLVGEKILHKLQNTSLFGNEIKATGKFPVVGPGAYERKWYASLTLVDGRLIKVS